VPRKSLTLAAAIFAVGAFAASARAADAPQPPQWESPTPADGAQFRVRVGKALRFSLAAGDGQAATLHVDATALPAGSTLASVDGDPATATFTWAPTEADVGRHALVFTVGDAADPARDAPPLRLEVRVLPPLAHSFRLRGPGAVARWADVVRPTIARAAPDASAPAVARVSTATSDALQNLVELVSGVRRGSETWVRVSLTKLPNGSTGWVPRAALGPFHLVRTHLYIFRRKFRAVLLRAGRPVFRAPVGVGRPVSPTPAGEFYVRELLTDFGNPFYGPLAFGTSARSNVLTDWPGGGVIGIHGTNAPQLLPGAVSHGCIRMRNADIVRLARVMPLGTPVTIR
jgi:hypothetical protein